MPLDTHQFINAWTEDDLLDLPDSETDDYEYKSSLIAENGNYRTDLQDKIAKTASAFWNTGGGVLIVGVNDRGCIDGGVPAMMGRQKLRDWVDVILTNVTPVGPYSVRTIRPGRGDTRIESEHVVLVIAFGESVELPHMAPDNRYYVRAGAHSNPANHYLVEAIRARRGLRRPSLRAMLRENPQKPGIIELVVLAINDLPALNVLVNFDPPPAHLRDEFIDRLPLLVPLIDRANPFRMDVATFQRLNYWFGDAPFTVQLIYEGVRGTRFEEDQALDHQRSLSPLQVTLAQEDNPDRLLEDIRDRLDTLNRTLTGILRTSQPPQPEPSSDANDDPSPR